MPRYCETTITVSHQRYENGTEFYHIKYAYTYSDTKISCLVFHPFYDIIREAADPLSTTPSCCNCVEGDVIVVNEMTTAMVKYLLMSFEDLSKCSGHTTPMTYKINIMHAIAKLWD